MGILRVVRGECLPVRDVFGVREFAGWRRPWMSLGLLAVLAVVGWLALGSVAVAQPVVLGATVSDAPLSIDASTGGAGSAVSEIDMATGPRVAFIERMPVTKRVTRVRLGKFASAASCTTPATVRVFVREHPTGSQNNSTQIAYSPELVSIGSTPQDVSWSIPLTTFERGRGYSFSLSGDGSSCRNVAQTSWARQQSDGGVSPGTQTCDSGPIITGSLGMMRRMWHEFGASDRDPNCANTTLNGAAFGSDMPTGWLVVKESSTTSSYVLTATNASSEPPASTACDSTGAAAGAIVKEWRPSPDMPGYKDYVCVWPQWAALGWRYPLDGWHHGLPWPGGTVRNAAIGLGTEAWQIPSREEFYGSGNAASPGVTHCAAADPVNCVTGNFYEELEDLAVAGRGPALAASRTYNAQLAAAQHRAGLADAPDALAVGLGWSHSYSTRLEVIDDTVVLHQDNASTATFRSAQDGSFVAAERVKARLTRGDSASYVVTYRDQTQDIFDSSGRLVRQLDRNGYATTLAYSPGGRLQTVSNDAGRTLSYDYNVAGRIATITDPLGRRVSYAYDSAGDLVSVTDAAGGVTRYGYDSKHRIVSMTDPRGNETRNAYDGEDRVTSQTDAAGGVTRFEYTTTSTTVTDAREHKTRYEQTNGLTTKVVRGVSSPQESTISMLRDASGNVTRRTDPDGQITTINYDTSANPTKITDPVGRITTVTYTASNDPATITDPVATTTLDYDTRGNVTSSSRPLIGSASVATTTYAYAADRPGDLTSSTDPNGKIWRYSYDSDGNQISKTDPEGNRTTTAYNQIGWATSTVNPRGNTTGADPAQFTTTFTRNDFGDLTRVEDPLGHATQTTYDANRNATTVTAADGKITRTTYDALNRPTNVTRPDDSTVRFAYDAAGNRTSVKDGLAHETTFSYDPLDRVTRQVDALNRATSYTYDASGRQTATQDGAGRTTTFGYDAASQLTSVSYSDGQTHAVSYDYDQLARRTKMTDATGTSTWTYDSLGRLTSSTDGANRTLGYTYDLGGRLTKTSYPSALVAQTAPGQTISDPSVTRGYDDAGRVTSITDWLDSTTGFSYDRAGNLTEQRYPNNTTAALTYDRADQLTQRTDTGPTGTILDLPYTRKTTGQIHTQNDTATQPAVNATLDYDARQQLSSVTVAGLPTASFAHDLADRLTRIDTATTATRLEYDAANQLTRTVNPTTGDALATFTYDDVGNRTSMQPATGGLLQTPAPTNYSYNQANQLTRAQKTSTSPTDPSMDKSYSYNGDGLRADLLWDHTAGLPLILADTQALYITGPDGLPLQRLGLDGARRYYHHDQLGSTRALTTTTGTVATRSDYDPYGNPTSTATTSNPFGYAGQYTDHTTGLIYMRARWYDPQTGQFITADPIGHASGETNLYRYAAGDPANFTDPTGLLGVPSLQGFADFAAGVYDDLSFGATRKIREFLGSDGVDYCSPVYATGGYAGAVGSFAVPGGTVLRTSRAARRAVMRKRRIPTSQQPSAQRGAGDRRQYDYETPQGRQVVTHHPPDENHRLPHWEAGPDRGGFNRHGQRRYGSDKDKQEYLR
ncbi:MAG: DUF6531 domain-containing protein [Chloroflexota bacterium]|nr:DUF6531 domain-containing protein [Chloroflexota bacterium]